MIGIFASSKDDIKLLTEKSKIIKTMALGKSLVMEALLEGQKVLLVITGYNKINLGIAAGYAGANYSLDAIIGLGNCGYLGNCDMKIGDLALGVSSVQYSVDSSAIGFPKTVIPDVGRGVFCSDPQLVQLAQYACQEIGYQYMGGRIATGEKFIANEKERDFIAKSYCCQFIDMECGGAGEVAFLMNIPVMFIKGISNYANSNAPFDFERYANLSNQRACNAALSMLKNMPSQFRF